MKLLSAGNLPASLLAFLLQPREPQAKYRKVYDFPPMKKAKISDLQFDRKNANKGTVRGRGAIEESLQKCGAGRSVLIDRNNRLIAGNKTTEVAGEIGLEDIIIVETDGTQIVAVKRTDLDLETDDRAKLLAIADNRSSELSLDWDSEVLAELNQEVDLSWLWSDDELSELVASCDRGDENNGSAHHSDKYQVMVDCGSSSEREQVLEHLSELGYKARAIDG